MYVMLYSTNEVIILPTIKNVAKLAGVSISTVSIVINGHANERNIPQATIDKVMRAVKELNYRPNVNARKLRSQEKKTIIALYWPLDSRTNMLASLLTGFQHTIDKNNLSCELIIKTYKVNHIKDAFDDVLLNSFDGVIVGAAAKEDLKYLESTTTNTPILLINRSSSTHSTVSISNDAILEYEMSLVDKNKKIFVVSNKSPYYAAKQRTDLFLNALKERSISNVTIIKTEDNCDGGIAIAKKFKKEKNAIICVEDAVIAIGLLYEFNRIGIKVPEDIEVFALDYSIGDYTNFLNPSLTTIYVPSDDIANAAVNAILSLTKDNRNIIHKSILPKLFFRESLPKKI